MPPGQPQRKRKDKKCNVCGRHFARSEHLNRHSLTHTKEKPFSCSICGRCFPRADVQNLHMRTCRNAYDFSASETGLSRERPTRRVEVACDNCRRRKTRCCGGHPCSSCSIRRSTCHYSTLSTAAEGSRPPDRDNTVAAMTPYSQPAFDIDYSSGSYSEIGSPFAGQVSLASGLPPATSTPQYIPAADSALALAAGQASDTFDASSIQVVTPASLDTTLYGNYLPPSPYELELNADGWDALSIVSTTASATDLSTSISTPGPPAGKALFEIMKEYFSRQSSIARTSGKIYPKPPHLLLYDTVIINAFLNLFRRHLGPGFPLFRDAAPTQLNNPKLCLAMAAVGGLFSLAKGSYEMAKAMYNDSRRLALAAIHIGPELPTNADEALDEVKMFILIELYGILSGDGRSFSMVEIHHVDLRRQIRSGKEW
ncbi:hypothetical protein CDD83_5737 [Cordyceps sp. RAO-2017]|nr:hypothetical protein CDD83_5737 [Cordyceps sp. RAO-2017]